MFSLISQAYFNTTKKARIVWLGLLCQRSQQSVVQFSHDIQTKVIYRLYIFHFINYYFSLSFGNIMYGLVFAFGINQFFGNPKTENLLILNLPICRFVMVVLDKNYSYNTYFGCMKIEIEGRKKTFQYEWQLLIHKTDFTEILVVCLCNKNP